MLDTVAFGSSYYRGKETHVSLALIYLEILPVTKLSLHALALDLLPVRKAQLVEYRTGITEVMGLSPVGAVGFLCNFRDF